MNAIRLAIRRAAPRPFALAALLMSAALALAGCMSMSGLGGSSKYACAAPEGVACDSVSGTYANALAHNLPSQRKRLAAQGASETQAPAAPASAAKPARPLAAGDADSLEPGLPLRAQARYLRLWIKPWEDIDGDLYDEAHVYVQIDQGRWRIDHVRQRIRDAYAPLRPPTPAPAAPQADASAPAIPTLPSEPAKPAAERFFQTPAQLLNSSSGEVSP
ncbi:MAG: type IV conjugative transfer system lipoprotein TraV [Desulfovibrionaceae bacterium]|nr:type IV conjugative transfer system lipoprotein TraV [Desulfovibrionaceae bacterium]